MKILTNQRKRSIMRLKSSYITIMYELFYIKKSSRMRVFLHSLLFKKLLDLQGAFYRNRVCKPGSVLNGHQSLLFVAEKL